MSRRKYAPLPPSEVVAILISLGFKLDRQKGSHAHYVCEKTGKYPRSLVTVAMSCQEFDDGLMKSMIEQSNRSRELFYGATRRTARKASVPFLKLSPSADTD
jgi:predicted RNA binding protein YcfA (HicA-like mRNA interferase family)